MLTAAIRRESRILVTGASGLLGSCVCAELSNQGFRAIGLSNKISIRIPSVEALKFDLSETGKIYNIISGLKPAAIVHCAAQTNVEWCEVNPADALLLNCQASAALAKSASGIPFIYISTDSVFDGETGLYDESAPPNPLNVYAASKYAGELAVAREHPAPAILRTNIFGFNPQPRLSLAEWIIEELAHNRSIGGFTDVIFNPLYTRDVAAIIGRILSTGLTGLYHAASPEPISKLEFAAKLAAAFGLDRDLVRPATLDGARFTAMRPKNTSLAASKLFRELQQSMSSIDDGIARLYSDWRNGYPERLRSYARFV
jgi:dTDP-4-dehydrorhamnose reductase